MVDCPHCDYKISKAPTGRRNKVLREKWKRKYAGGIITKVIGDTRPQNIEGLNQEPPDGMIVIDRCGSCGWTSEKTYHKNNPEGKKWIYK